MSVIAVTNPGCVNVVTQSDGPLSVDQPVTVGPSSNPSTATPALAGGGLGGSPITITNPGSDNVVNQTFDGLPKNVIVA